tara:strand:- start:3078 stop:4004 length:927 start_codon:yes stop_codon:yes gene_type:complete
MSKILVTGGSGMVGKHLQKILPNAEYFSSRSCNLKRESLTSAVFYKMRPDVVIHLAAKVGGILDNIRHPVEFFEDNIAINNNVIKSAYESGCKKIISVLSTCIYPDEVPESDYPMVEASLHSGPPTPTNFAYGYAKRCLAVQLAAYNQQHNTQYSTLIPCNLYSEYDHFEGERAHFLSSLINKIDTAKRQNAKKINLLGTGAPLRQFMYAGDLAEAIVLTLDKDDVFNYNICTPENKSIKEICDIALEACDATHLSVEWDETKPDGQYRKDASSKRFLKDFPDFKFTKLVEGIKKTYNIISNERVETK